MKKTDIMQSEYCNPHQVMASWDKQNTLISFSYVYEQQDCFNNNNLLILLEFGDDQKYLSITIGWNDFNVLLFWPTIYSCPYTLLKSYIYERLQHKNLDSLSKEFGSSSSKAPTFNGDFEPFSI